MQRYNRIFLSLLIMFLLGAGLWCLLHLEHSPGTVQYDAKSLADFLSGKRNSYGGYDKENEGSYNESVPSK